MSVNQVKLDLTARTAESKVCEPKVCYFPHLKSASSHIHSDALASDSGRGC
jgi:hypothetical protein